MGGGQHELIDVKTKKRIRENSRMRQRCSEICYRAPGRANIEGVRMGTKLSTSLERPCIALLCLNTYKEVNNSLRRRDPGGRWKVEERFVDALK